MFKDKIPPQKVAENQFRKDVGDKQIKRKRRKEHISGKDKISSLKRYMHPNVHSSTSYNSQDMEAT